MTSSRERRWYSVRSEDGTLDVGRIIVAVVLAGVAAWAFMMVYFPLTALTRETRAEFSEQFSCPLDKITLTKRPDVDATEFEGPAREPPAEIAADPARLAVWKSKQPKGWSVDFFELTGCGHHVLWGCRLPSSRSSAGVHAFCPYTRNLDATASAPSPREAVPSAPSLMTDF